MLNIFTIIKSWLSFKPKQQSVYREDALQMGSYIAWWKGEIPSPKIYPRGSCISFINMRNENMEKKYGPCKGNIEPYLGYSQITEEELISNYMEYTNNKIKIIS
jgi:hypothetical protein